MDTGDFSGKSYLKYLPPTVQQRWDRILHFQKFCMALRERLLKYFALAMNVSPHVTQVSYPHPPTFDLSDISSLRPNRKQGIMSYPWPALQERILAMLRWWGFLSERCGKR